MTAPPQRESDKQMPWWFPPEPSHLSPRGLFRKKPRLPPGEASFIAWRRCRSSARFVAGGREREILGAEQARAAMLVAELRLAPPREGVAIGDNPVEIDRRGAELDLA